MFHNVVQHRSVRPALCFGNRQYKARHQQKSAQQANVRAEWQSGKQAMLTQCSWLLHQWHCQQHQYTACRDAKHAIASRRIGTYKLSDTTIRLRERVRVR